MTLLETLTKLERNFTIDRNHRWGYEVRMTNQPKYCGKFLVLTTKEPSSYHFHKKKAETFITLEGMVKLKVGMISRVLRSGEQENINPGEKHQFSLYGIEKAVILEVSTHHRDDDTYRLEE